MHRSVWAIAFLLTITLLGSIGAINLDLKGTYDVEFRRLGPGKVEAKDQLIIDSDITSAVRIYIRGIGIRGLWKNLHQPHGTLDLDLAQVYTSAKVRPFEGSEPLTIRFGTLDLNYSPYLLRLDGSGKAIIEGEKGLQAVVFNPYRRGLHIQEVQIGKSLNEGFVLWEDRAEDIAFGGKSEIAFNKITLKGMGVTFIKNYIDETPDAVDTAYGLELLYRLPQKGAIELVMAKQNLQEHGRISKKASMGTVAYLKDFGTGIIGNFEYRYFEPEFDPRYRDRTPRFSHDGELLSWNPVDEKQGQKGIAIELDAKLPKTSIGLNLLQYRNLKEQIDHEQVQVVESKIGKEILGFSLHAELMRIMSKKLITDHLTGVIDINYQTTTRTVCELIKKPRPFRTLTYAPGFKFSNLEFLLDEGAEEVKIHNFFVSLRNKAGYEAEFGTKTYTIAQKRFLCPYFNVSHKPVQGLSWSISYMPTAAPIENSYDMMGKTYIGYGNEIYLKMSGSF